MSEHQPMIQMKTPPLRDAILRHLTYSFGKDPEHAILEDWRMALSYAVRDRIVDAWFKATERTYDTGAKRVYYLSMEFLIGRLLGDGIVNLELVDEAKAALAEFSKDYNEVLTDEPDAALGNGGLGRLAFPQGNEKLVEGLVLEGWEPSLRARSPAAVDELVTKIRRAKGEIGTFEAILYEIFINNILYPVVSFFF